MLPLNKHSPPHPINIEISALGAYSWICNKVTARKKVSQSNPLMVRNFQDKMKIAETLVFQRTIHHPLIVHVSLEENVCRWNLPNKKTFPLNYVSCPFDIVTAK